MKCTIMQNFSKPAFEMSVLVLYSYYWKILVCQWVLPFTATSQQEVQSADIINEKGSPQKETSAWKRLETFTVFLKVSSPT